MEGSLNKRQVAILICTVALVIGALSLWMPAPTAAPQQKEPQPQRIRAPKAVLYSALFHHVADVMQQADETQRQGKDASSLRAVFQEKANLSEAQARVLDTVATLCVREVAVQDARAQQIINAFKARFPPGRLPKGVKLPAPPAELKQMQEERDAMILRARDRLRVALGENEFQRFDEFVTKRVASRIEPVTLHPKASERARPTEPNRSGVITTEGGAK
jgi:hypothetical protein